MEIIIGIIIIGLGYVLYRTFQPSATVVETAVAYKVEAPVVEAPKVEQFPFPAKAEKKTADKKPVAKAKTARKPRSPKA
jgi:hypothetical protein